jgi:hypothetical protein
MLQGLCMIHLFQVGSLRAGLLATSGNFQFKNVQFNLLGMFLVFSVIDNLMGVDIHSA